MKKLVQAIIILIALFGITAYADAPDLIFTPTEGIYIYCNNHEFIRRHELADTSNPNPKFIMNNENMTSDKYSLFVSHVNHTEVRNENNTITEAGFDIEIDVIFRAKDETEITFNAAGFEVPKNGQYRYNGSSYTYEDAWGCLNCWATYLNMPIRQMDSGTVYSPQNFDAVTVTIPAGEDFWLSEILPNYSVVPFFRPMNLMCDFEINSGVCDINVAALKATGTLGDRSNFAENSTFGTYDRDYQYKGVANSMNEVNADLSYEITDDTWSGSALPVKLYNQHHPNGHEVTKWYTHLNPRSDPWSGDISTESDMLAFEYYDPSKLNYYGKAVPESEKSDTWYFDTHHRDTSAYSKEYGDNAQKYVPNRPLTDKDGTDFACNLGNYGVKLNYSISITNSGNLTRYACYKLSTSSNNVVYVKDADGKLLNGYAVCKGTEESRVSDYIACVPLPAHNTTDFTVTVILTTNYSGGMQNELIINDMPKPVLVYESTKQEITRSPLFNGKEYYKWASGNLYLSSDDMTDTDFRPVALPQSVHNDITGNYNEYRLYWTGNGYVLKPSLYDGIPYYTVQEFFKTVYFFDKDFNYTGSYKFKNYPKAYANASGIDYFYAGSPMYTADSRKTWKYTDDTDMPCWNYGRLSAMTKNGRIYLSENGIDFNRVKYQSFDGDYIDAIGNYYYYADGKTLYYSDNGVYWVSFVNDEKIKSIDVSEVNLILNMDTVIEPHLGIDVIIKADGNYLGFDKKPYISKDGVTYAPLRFMCESLGAEVEWIDGNVIISKDKLNLIFTENSRTVTVNGRETSIGAPMINDNGTSMIPVRTIAELLGYDVSYSDGIVTIE